MSSKKAIRAARYKYLKLLNLPEMPNEFVRFKTYAGLPIANGYLRVVIGARGPYVEFDKFQMVSDSLKMPSGEEWRIGHDSAYYIEYRSKCSAMVKIYFQKRKVDYADYRLGCLYISPYDMVSDIYDTLIERQQMGLFKNEHKRSKNEGRKGSGTKEQ